MSFHGCENAKVGLGLGILSSSLNESAGRHDPRVARHVALAECRVRVPKQMRVPPGRLNRYNDATCHTQASWYITYSPHTNGGRWFPMSCSLNYGPEKARNCCLGKMIQPSLRDFWGSIIYPAFRSRSMPGYFQPRLRRWLTGLPRAY